MDNPVCIRKQYRLYTIHKLPWLRFLDFEKVRQSEKEEAKKIFGERVEVSRNIQAADQGEKKSTAVKRAIQQAIMNAKTPEEINRLEQLLKSGDSEEVLRVLKRM